MPQHENDKEKFFQKDTLKKLVTFRLYFGPVHYIVLYIYYVDDIYT